MPRSPFRITLVAALLTPTSLSLAQSLPTSQPALVTIYREVVKPGRSADHARVEAGWPAAYQKAKSPDYYLALTTMTGPPEAWYITPHASHAAIEAGMKRDESNATLSAELQRLSRTDAEHLERLTVVQAAARSDMSAGAYPDLARARFWEISTWRLRPGHDAAFGEAAKAYTAAARRAGGDPQFRVYEVIAGMPGPTYMIFSSLTSYGQFDRMMESGQKTMASATPAELATLEKFMKESVITVETQRFRLDPGMSYVSAETRAVDPAFWSPRKATARASTP